MSNMSKKSKMFQFINSRLRVRLGDDRVLVGKFLAFDRHMNLVLADTEEFRTIVSKGAKEEREEKRALGLVLLRGEHVVAMSVDGSKAANTDRFKQQQPGQGLPGPGKAAAVGRAVPAPGIIPQMPAGRGMPAAGMGIPPPPGMPMPPGGMPGPM
eukprot:TRINITY_DN105276_c0_g1_i1.p1 TRINITY_DN105276_c0_g1~~TRINITY_DN105276_c0_g1_i1.p1  ORF type:complete len:155 (+),score=8.59 TRINITY_DN105276_c0_g1_i1:71-535(+)